MKKRKRVLTVATTRCMILCRRGGNPVATIKRFVTMVFRLRRRTANRTNIEIPGMDPRVLDRVDPTFLAMVDKSIRRNRRALQELAKY